MLYYRISNQGFQNLSNVNQKQLEWIDADTYNFDKCGEQEEKRVHKG